MANVGCFSFQFAIKVAVGPSVVPTRAVGSTAVNAGQFATAVPTTEIRGVVDEGVVSGKESLAVRGTCGAGEDSWCTGRCGYSCGGSLCYGVCVGLANVSKLPTVEL